LVLHRDLKAALVPNSAVNAAVHLQQRLGRP